MALYGKFNRPDPMRDWDWLMPHTMNLYEYVGNDPVNAWDPDGMKLKDIAPQLAMIWGGAATTVAVLVADDVTVVGIVDDVAIVPVAVGAIGLSLIDIVYNVLDEVISNAQEKSGPIGGGTSEMSDNSESSGPSLPGTPEEILDQGYNDTSNPDAASAGHRTFENPETGDKVRWDQGKPGAKGWEGKDHWHQYNPNATGKKDQYLDKNGNPTPRGSDASHIEPKTLPPAKTETEEKGN